MSTLYRQPAGTEDEEPEERVCLRSPPGQSFMLHQIRKMIGTVMAVARGHAAESVFERAWSLDRIDLPMAPALGLMLNEVSHMRMRKMEMLCSSPWCYAVYSCYCTFSLSPVDFSLFFPS